MCESPCRWPSHLQHDGAGGVPVRDALTSDRRPGYSGNGGCDSYRGKLCASSVVECVSCHLRRHRIGSSPRRCSPTGAAAAPERRCPAVPTSRSSFSARKQEPLRSVPRRVTLGCRPAHPRAHDPGPFHQYALRGYSPASPQGNQGAHVAAKNPQANLDRAAVVQMARDCLPQFAQEKRPDLQLLWRPRTAEHAQDPTSPSRRPEPALSPFLRPLLFDVDAGAC